MDKCIDTQRLIPKHCSFSKNRVLYLAVVMVLVGAGCTGKVAGHSQTLADSTSTSSKYRLSTLKIGVLPTQTLTEQEQMIKPLKEYLERSFGQRIDNESPPNILGGQGRQERQGGFPSGRTLGTQRVQSMSVTSFDFQIAKDYKEIIDWLVQGKLDMAYLSPLAYLEAVDRGAKVEPLVAAIDIDTRQPWYRACIIVKQDSPIKTLKDLKGRRIAFVDKSSTSGYLMPVATFNQIGIDSQRDFAQVLYAGSHSKSLAALEDGSVDAAATNVSSYLKRQKSGKLTPENSRVLWESAPIPNSPIVVSQKLPPEVILELKQAFISSPDGIEDIMGIESTGYTLVIPSDYAPIQRLRKNIKLSSITAQ
ncbi:phosphonate ABC transporter substrate-binding protein [Nostoc minutum NIES-26]|uniref:Phosphonate ABC transporter substrate-binding protein n=1 Tax=Nostoc minutum NIES-26 TaxID=1844469 RepID=A0A367QPF5_9NOSO|nr:phosphonate ABC transporter substrate-binding protein [Nostoc minutum NIES-26]